MRIKKETLLLFMCGLTDINSSIEITDMEILTRKMI